MSLIPDYGKIFHIGSSECSQILDGDVYLQEKIDGSQFSFAKIGDKLHFRSKAIPFVEDEITKSQKMFIEGVDAIVALKEKLPPNVTFRGEYLRVPRHNTLVYDRVPPNHVIIFDVMDNGRILYPEEAVTLTASLGFEYVPCEKVSSLTLEGLHEYLQRKSCLGAVKVEGCVIKNYARFSPYGGTLMAKFVSEEFKELNKGVWKVNRAAKADIKELLGMEIGQPARYLKSIQRLEETNSLEMSPRDIGKLFKEVQKDLEEECTNYLKDRLFEVFWPHISRVATRGIPTYYKEWLLKRGFAEVGSEVPNDT